MGFAIFDVEFTCNTSTTQQILPLENKMKTPKDTHRVIFFSMIVVTLLFTIFGVLGYIVYGSDIKGSITLNLISSSVIEVM